MSASGQTRSFGYVGSMSGLREIGHWLAIYEYTPYFRAKAGADKELR
jgi:hypothetical protein